MSKTTIADIVRVEFAGSQQFTAREVSRVVREKYGRSPARGVVSTALWRMRMDGELFITNGIDSSGYWTGGKHRQFGFCKEAPPTSISSKAAFEAADAVREKLRHTEDSEEREDLLGQLDLLIDELSEQYGNGNVQVRLLLLQAQESAMQEVGR